VAALAVGVSLGVTPQALAREAEGVLARAGLPVDLAAQPMETALRWMGYDKKRQGRSVRAVLLERVGAPVIRMLPLAELAARVLESSQRNLASGGTCR
jgi:3-dehydroquinate synthetase